MSEFAPIKSSMANVLLVTIIGLTLATCAPRDSNTSTTVAIQPDSNPPMLPLPTFIPTAIATPQLNPTSTLMPTRTPCPPDACLPPIGEAQQNLSVLGQETSGFTAKTEMQIDNYILTYDTDDERNTETLLETLETAIIDANRIWVEEMGLPPIENLQLVLGPESGGDAVTLVEVDNAQGDEQASCRRNSIIKFSNNFGKIGDDQLREWTAVVVHEYVHAYLSQTTGQESLNSYDAFESQICGTKPVAEEGIARALELSVLMSEGLYGADYLDDMTQWSTDQFLDRHFVGSVDWFWVRSGRDAQGRRIVEDNDYGLWGLHMYLGNQMYPGLSPMAQMGRYLQTYVDSIQAAQTNAFVDAYDGFAFSPPAASDTLLGFFDEANPDLFTSATDVNHAAEIWLNQVLTGGINFLGDHVYRAVCK